MNSMFHIRPTTVQLNRSRRHPLKPQPRRPHERRNHEAAYAAKGCLNLRLPLSRPHQTGQTP